MEEQAHYWRSSYWVLGAYTDPRTTVVTISPTVLVLQPDVARLRYKQRPAPQEKVPRAYPEDPGETRTSSVARSVRALGGAGETRNRKNKKILEKELATAGIEDRNLRR